MTPWPFRCRPPPSARAAELGCTPGPSMIRMFMLPLPLLASGGLCLGRGRFGADLAPARGTQFVLELRVELEDFARQLAEDFLVPHPPRLGEVVAVRAVRVARDLEQAAADEIVHVRVDHRGTHPGGAR